MPYMFDAGFSGLLCKENNSEPRVFHDSDVFHDTSSLCQLHLVIVLTLSAKIKPLCSKYAIVEQIMMFRKVNKQPGMQSFEIDAVPA